ncbi:MAG: serine/threonine-protein kinase [Candidatus Melainabacteria bacterium]|nr:serine/threonine-protein kinase [Candidatus Melainabacteria bacterium]
MKKINFSHEQYLALEEIGRGGMGVVYKCSDRKMGRSVAVKVIGWNLSDTDTIRFHKEAKALAKLQHPNILSVLHFGHSDDDSLFLVMELLTGQSLSSLIDSGILPRFEEALCIFLKICDGLAHAHKKDVLHRDIKPSNIFVERTTSGDINTIITDFGLAKLLTEDQRLTQTGVSLGTPAYMSPEQAAGKTVDERSDIYSLGCLMFEVLTGEQPFQSGNVTGLMLKQVNEPPPRLSDVAPDRNYPEEMEEILAKCLAKNPDERYSEISELKNDIHNLKNNSVIVYAQIDSGSEGSQSDSAAKMNEFLRTGVQQSTPRARAGKAVVVTSGLLLLIGLIGFITNLGSFGLLEKKEQPLTGITVMGSKNDNKDTENFIDLTLKISRTEELWIPCTGQGGAKRLLDVVQNERMSRKQRGTRANYYIDARNSDVTDKQLHALKSINVIGLRLGGTAVGDDAIKNTVSKLADLEELSLRGTQVTDECAQYLTANEKLDSIDLSQTKISDKSIPILSELKSLRFICAMSCPNLTGSTFGALKNLRHDSVDLSVDGSNINQENLKLLQNLPMRYLDVSGLKLNDNDMEVISRISSLQIVILNRNPEVTQKGFLQLAKLKKLAQVGVHGCPKITPATITHFNSVHPTPKIVVVEPES